MDDPNLQRRFGKAVRRLRQEQGFSQEGFAAACDIDRAYMGGLERGQRNPSLTTINRIARGLRIKASELIAAVERTR